MAYPAHRRSKNTATSQPSPIGVSGTPGITGVLSCVVGIYPSLELFALPSSTPPFRELAIVLIVPLAITKGAVDEVWF